MRRASNAEVFFKDFSGGQASVKGSGSLAANELAVLENLIILPEGGEVRNRPGNTAHNSAVSGGHPLMGVGYRKFSGTGALYAVADNKVYWDSGLSGTFTDVTGSVSISSDPDNLWSFFSFNSVIIGVGGNQTDMPIMHSGTGNFSDLTNAPTAADIGFEHANRAFLVKGSKVWWSVLDDHTDWTGTGSGSQNASKDDGEDITLALPLDINTVLLCKESSMYVLSGRTNPFPIFKLFDKAGAAGKLSGVAVNGVAYVVSPKGEFIITDGKQVLTRDEVPRLRNIDDIFAGGNSTRWDKACVAHKRGDDYEWIIVSFTKDHPNQNEYAVAWDMINKCWISLPTGFNGNGYVELPDGTLYMAGYDGIVYKQLVEGTYTDASNAAAAVSWKLRSDELRLGSLLQTIKVDQARIQYRSASSGTMTFKWSYDSPGLSNSSSLSIQQTGDVWGTGVWGTAKWASAIPATKSVRCLGRGNYFKWGLEGSSQVDTRIYTLSFIGKQRGQKQFNAR